MIYKNWKCLVLFIFVVGMLVYVVFVVMVMLNIDCLFKWFELLIYIFFGIVWVILFCWVFLGIGKDDFDVL